MIAVVTGSGAGLVNTSKSTVGAEGEIGQSSTGQAGESVSVNAANGNLVIQQLDEYLVGIGPDASLLRTYNSQGVWDGDNGDGWRMGYYRRISLTSGTLNTAGSTLSRIEADGFEAKYSFDGTRYVSTDGSGAYDTLTVDAATKTARWVDGDTGISETYAQESVASNYRLAQVTDPEGHAIKVAYDATTGLISTISSWKAGAAAADETLTLTYDSATKQLKKLVTSNKNEAGVAVTRSRVSYTYRADGRLSKVTTDLSPQDNAVTDGKVYVVSYDYNAAGRVSQVAQSDGSKLDIAYYDDGRVKTVTDALTRVTAFAYDTVTNKTTVTDPLKQTTVLAYDAAQRLTEISGAAQGGAAFKQSFTYSANGKGDLATSKNAKGEVTTFAYNANGALTRSTDAAGNVHDFAYDAANRLSSDTGYLLPDPDGADKSGLPSGEIKTQYVYDTGAGSLRRLRFAVSPEGRVTQYEYNALGQQTVSTQYINAAYVAAGAATLAGMTAWASALSVADRAAVQRTVNDYDLRGQVAATKTYSANTVNGAEVVYGGESQQTFVRDAFGRLLQTIDANHNTTATAYDGLNRVILTTDAKQVGTVTLYNDAGMQTTLQLANGLSVVSTRDAAGRLITSTQIKDKVTLGETRYFYDALDRPVMTQDPTGLRSWMLYDPSGRIAADISASGRVTESIHDAAGHLVQRIQYATPLSAAALASLVDAAGLPVQKTLAELRPAADVARDRIATQFFDQAGRLVGTQDADGAVTETAYDGLSRVLWTRAYATRSAITRIAPAAGSTVATPPALASVRPKDDALNDRRTRSIYSADGLLMATVDAEGYLTELRYDRAGRLTEKIAYATATDASKRVSGPLAELIPAVNADDQRSVWLYDGRGLVVGEIDPEGYLTETAYDPAGLRQQSVRYAKAVAVAVTSKSSLLGIRPASTPADLSITWKHDELGRVSLETTSDGTITQYVYDSVGNLTSTVKAQGQPEVRTFNARYDAQGRLIAELSAEGAIKLVGTQTQAEIDALWKSYGSSYSYDKSGRRIKAVDARGSTTVYYYDAEGRQVLSILKTEQGGEVRQVGYNTFGDANSSTVYAKRLAVADAVALEGGLLTAALTAKVSALSDAAQDVQTRSVYDRRSQVQKAIDALNQTVDYQYTAFGQRKQSLADVDTTRRLQTDLLYDRRGWLTSTQLDAPGLNAITRSEYDAFGRVTATVDARQQRSTIDYQKNDGKPDSGRKVVVTDASLAQHTTVYDAFDQVLQQYTGAQGNGVTYQHDRVNRKMTMTTAEGVVTVTEFTRFGQVVKVTDGSTATSTTPTSTTYTYDHDGNLLTTTDALGNVSRNSYDTVSNLVTETVGLKANPPGVAVDDGSSSITKYTYDAANRVLTKTDDAVGSGQNLQTRYEYDGRSRAVKVTDAGGTVTRYHFDATGQLKDTVVDDSPTGLKLKTSFTYDAQGHNLTVIEGDGTPEAKTSEYRYDVLGRRTHEIVDPAGLKLATEYQYDASGNVVLRLDGLNQATRYVYDASGRLKYTIDATMGVARRAYDAEGRLTSTRAYAKPLAAPAIALAPAALSDAQIETSVSALESGADELTQYAYDKDGRQTHVIDAEGGVTQSRYDKSGRVVETLRYATPSRGTWTASSVPTVDSARDQSTRFVYDAAGRVRFTIDPLNFVTSQAYDRQGRVTTTRRYANAIARPATVSEASVTAAIQADANADRTEYNVYDSAGRLRHQVDAAGYVTTRNYDARGQVKSTLRSTQPISVTGLPTLAQASAYASLKSFDGSAAGVSGNAHVYDNNRIKLVNKPVEGGGWAGTRSTTTLPLGGTVKFDVTPNAIQPGLHAGVDSVAPSPYGRVVALFKSDGNVWAQVYDGDKGSEFKLGAYTPGVTYRVEIGTDEAGGATLSVYDLSKPREAGYSYKTEGPLSWTSFSTVFYTDQHAGLAGETTATVDNLAEQSAIQLSQNSYDAAGRLTASINAEGTVTRYGYDGAGRVTKVTQQPPASSSGQPNTTERRYDAAGRMVQETLAAGTAEAATTRYQYDANGRVKTQIDPRGVALAESDSAWAISERQAQGLATSAASLSAAGKQALLDKYSTRFGYDAVGRRRTVTDALGTVTTTTYDALGRAVAEAVQSGSGGDAFVSYRYHDKLDRVVQQVDAERYLSGNTFDAFGNLTDTVRYDQRVAGTLAAQSAALSAITVAAVAPAGSAPYVLLAASFDAANHSEFNRRNELLWQQDAEGYQEGTLDEAGKPVALDAFGQRKSVRNKLGGVASFTYDRLGRVITETLPVTALDATGKAVKVVNKNVYDSRGNRTQTIEALGLKEQRTTLYAFDAMNRIVRKTGMAYTTADGNTVQPADAYRYDAYGNTIEQITGGQLVHNMLVGGKRSVAYYDARQQKTVEVSADGVQSRYAYDAAGNLVIQRILATPLSAAPSVLQVPIDTRSADDRALSYRYDALGRKTQTRLDGVISWSAGTQAPLTETASRQLPSQASGPETIAIETLVYDAWGRLVQRKDANGNTSVTRYDAIGRKLLTVDADNAVVAWDYGHAQSVATREVRYAGRLATAPSAQQTTAALRAAAQASSAAVWAQVGGEASRVLDFGLDRLGRVVSQSVASVQSEYIAADGTRTSRSSTAITGYQYDGLGHVTQITQRAAERADGSSVLELTDIAYDKLGRETSRQAPGFTDFEGVNVRPRNDTDYDAVGNVARRIQRGKNDSTEADDRITRYSYDGNGQLLSETDPALAVTRYAYDARGDLVRRTLVDVHDSRGNARSLVTQYERDGSGRITLERDVETGSTQMTSYNAFGEVAKKGRNGDWQEYAYYTTLGKVWKTNSGDGAYKIYLQDKNGNNTREIRAVGDHSLAALDLISASNTATTLSTVSIYDKRNLLVQTFEPQMEFQTSEESLSQLVTEQWVPQYGPIGIGDSAGGTYEQTTVSSGPLLTAVQAGQGDVARIAEATPQVLQSGVTLAPPISLAITGNDKEALFWPGVGNLNVNGTTYHHATPEATRTSLTIPSTWPAGTYRVTQTSSLGSPAQTTNPIVTIDATKGATVEIGAGFGGAYSFSIDMQHAGDWIPVAKVEYTKTTQRDFSAGSSGSQGWTPGFGTYSNSHTIYDLSKKIYLDAGAWSAASFVVIADPGQPSAQRLNATHVAADSSGKLTAIALPDGLLSGQHVVRVLGLDANGHVVSGRDINLNYGPSGLSRSQAAIASNARGDFAWIEPGASGSQLLRFDIGAGAGSAGQIHYRAKGSEQEWKVKDFSGSTIDAASLNAFGGVEVEFALSGPPDRYGVLAFNGAAASVGLLRDLTLTNEEIQLRLPLGADTWELKLNGVAIATRLVLLPAEQQWVLKVSGDEIRQAVQATRWSQGTANWSYVVKNAAGIEMQMNQGTLAWHLPADLTSALGRSLEFQADGQPHYVPEAFLRMGGQEGNITLGGTGVVLDTTQPDARLRKGSDQTGAYVAVNLRDFLPAWPSGERVQVNLRFDGSTEKGLSATVPYWVYASGKVEFASDAKVTQPVTHSPIVSWLIPGATKISEFKVDGHVIGSPTKLDTGVFSWDTSGYAVGKSLTYEYTAQDASGRTVSKGRGTITLAEDGTVKEHVSTPDYLDMAYSFAPPAGTSRLTVTMTGPKGVFAQTLTSETGFSFNLSPEMRPAAGEDAYTVQLSGLNESTGELTIEGHTMLRIDSSGHTRSDAPTITRRPVPVHFQISGREIGRAQLKLTDLTSGAVVAMVDLQNLRWVVPPLAADGAPTRKGYTDLTWDASSIDLPPGTYAYQVSALDAEGQVLRDERNQPLVQSGRVNLSASGAKPVLLQSSWVLNASKSVMVAHQQSYNAYGEVIEERDDGVEARMKAMLGRAETDALTPAEQAAARTTLSYNTLGQLITKTDAQSDITLGNGYRYRDRPVTRFGYDLMGRLVSTTDANGNLSEQITLAGSSAQQSLASTEYFGQRNEGGSRSTGYDVFGDARRIIDQNGNVITQSYDAMSRLISVAREGVRRVDSNGVEGALFTLRSEYKYDERGQRLQQTDAAGTAEAISQQTDYDSLGRVIATTDGLQHVTRYSYENLSATGADTVQSLGGRSTGGTKRTTLQADGRTLIDKTDAFGHTTWHQDLSGVGFSYRYNEAGQLVQQTSGLHVGQTQTQDIRYSYYANGYLQSATDAVQGTLSQYTYDNAGNRTGESYFQLVKNADGSQTTNAAYQNATIRYDELNRVVQVSDVNYLDIRYEYDAVGNRRMVDSLYLDGAAGLRGHQTYWYDYDSLNRFTVTKGQLSGARETSKAGQATKVQAGVEGTALSYDRLGQRTQAKYTLDGQAITEIYGYSQDGYLETTTHLTAAGSTLSGVRVLDLLGRTTGYYDKVNNNDTLSYYDANSRLKMQVYTDRAHTERSGTTTYEYFNAVPPGGTDGAGSGDGAGLLKSTVFVPSDGKRLTTSYSYDYWDDGRQSLIVKDQQNDSGRDQVGRSTLSYNVNGHLQSTNDQYSGLTTRYFNNANGQILKRERQFGFGTVGSHYYYYADGKRVGDVGDDAADNTRVSYAEQLAAKKETPQSRLDYYKNFKPVSSADFDQNFEPINESYPSAVPGSYTVRGGESMQAIAQALWGDKAMWYLIAEANGLRGDEALKSGQVLTIPNKVTNIHNNSQTFRPYNAGEAIGHIDPTLPPPPPPPSKGGCGGIGTILVVAIAVVATVYTAGAAAGLLSVGGATGGAWAAGTAVLSGQLGFGAAALGAAAIGGAVGSIASQGAAMGLGMQEHFQWSSVGQAALGSAVTAGVGGLARGGQALSALNNSSEWASAGRATLSSGATQALRGHWNWQEVMASGLGAGVGAGVGRGLVNSGASTWMQSATNQATGELGIKIAAGLAGGVVGQWAGPGGKAQYNSVFNSTLGSVIGNGFVDSMAPAQASGPGLKAARNSNGMSLSGQAVNQWSAQTDVRIADESQRMANARAFLDMEPMADANDVINRSLQETLGTIKGVANVIQGGVRFVNDQGWTTADAVTGGWLARNNEAARAAVERNTALGNGLLNVPEKAAGLALRGMTGNLSYEEIKQGVSSGLRLDEIHALRARGDYAGAQELVTENVLNAASLLMGAGPGARSLLGFAGSAGETGLIGARLAAEEFGASSIGQGIAVRGERFNYANGLTAYAAEPGAVNVGNAEVTGSGALKRVGLGDNANFASDSLLTSHFEKHGSEFRTTSSNDYLNTGRDIMNNGQPVNYFYEAAGENRTGYVSFMRNRSSNGEALFGFVGTNNDGFITTIHVKSRTDLFDLLGDQSQSALKAFRTDTIGPKPQTGWKWPYSW